MTTAAAPVYSFKISRSRIRQGFVVGGLSILIGIWASVFGQQAADHSGWIALFLVFIGLGAIGHAVYRLRDGQPRLIIDARGVWFAEWDLPAVPWDQIVEIYQTGMRLRAFVTLQMRDQDAYFASLPGTERHRIRLGKLIKQGFFLIPQGAVEATPQEIETAIRAARAHYLS